MPFIQPTFTNTSGLPCNGCLLYSYAAGTTTPQATYSDYLLTQPNTNPLVLNTLGRPSGSGGIYLSAVSYKFVLTTSSGATVWTRDNIYDYGQVLGGPWTQANGNIYPTTLTNRVLTDGTSSDLAGTGGLVDVNGFIGVVSGSSNAAGMTLAYNSGDSAMAISTIKTGSAPVYPPLEIRIGGTVNATYDTTGLLDVGNGNDIITGFATPLNTTFRTYSRLATSNSSTDNFTSVQYIDQLVATTHTAQANIAWAYSSAPSGTVNFLVANEGDAVNNGAATVTNMRGVIGNIITESTGNTTNAMSIYAGVGGRLGGGTGTITNGYGLYVPSFGAGFTNKYSIYTNDSTAINYFTSPFLAIGGIQYTWPNSQSVSACLITDGIGNLSWGSCASGSIGGSGTTNKLAKFSAAATIANSSITDTGSAVTIAEPTTFSGTITLNGLTYTWPGSQSASQCLQTNGSGTLTWASCGAGGGITGGGTTGLVPVYVGSTAVGNSSIADNGTTVTITEPVIMTSTLQINGLTYTWPASVSGVTCLQNNGSNSLTWATCSGGGGVSGSGTANTITKWSGSTSVGNSGVTDDGTYVTTSERLIVGGSSSDVAGTTGQINVANFLAVMSGPSNATGMSIAYNSGANKMYVAGIATGSGTQVPIDFRASATTVARVETSGTDRFCVYMGSSLHLLTLSGGNVIDGGACP